MTGIDGNPCADEFALFRPRTGLAFVVPDIDGEPRPGPWISPRHTGSRIAEHEAGDMSVPPEIEAELDIALDAVIDEGEALRRKGEPVDVMSRKDDKSCVFAG